jgi:hypothetical protein
MLFKVTVATPLVITVYQFNFKEQQIEKIYRKAATIVLTIGRHR